MAQEFKFDGFSKSTFKFFKDLENNNTKEWFQANRTVFEEHVMNPAQEYIMAMGELLKPMCPKIVANPKVDKSIFRIYRDVRFSKDKTPYKTHLGIFLWEGPRKKLGNPGFYLQFDKSKILIAGGLYQFPPELMKPYRDAVSDEKKGAEVAKILKKILKNKSYILGGKHYKRIPRGYDEESPNADLPLHNSLFVYYEGPVPKETHSPKFLDYSLKVFKEMLPLHNWIKENVSG